MSSKPRFWKVCHLMENQPDRVPDPLAKVSRPIFKVLGCLTVLFLTMGVGLLISLWMVVSGGLPTEPIPLPPLPETKEDFKLPDSWFEGEEAISMTPEEWNWAFQKLTLDAIDRGDLAANSGIRWAGFPDNSILIQASLGVPEKSAHHSFLQRGRFLNFKLTGDLHIENGDVASIRLDSYTWGFIYTQQEGEYIKESMAKTVVSRLIDELISYRFMKRRVKTLKYENSKLTLQLEKE